VIGFTLQPGGGYTVAFERHEATLISDLAWQIAELLSPLASVPASEPDAHSQITDNNLLAKLDAEGSLRLHGDPAIARLLPDAYGDEADADSASDFRRYTEQGLVDRKVANALVVINTLAPSIDDGISDGTATDPADLADFAADSTDSATGSADSADGSQTRLQLTESQAQSWLRTLTDIRLTLASRIGIETDEDALDEDAFGEDVPVADVLDEDCEDSDADTGSTTGSSPDNTAPFLRDVYHWLGFVSESLLAAIDREPDARPH